MTTICRLHFLKGDPASTCIAMFGLIVFLLSQRRFLQDSKKKREQNFTTDKLQIKDKREKHCKAGHHMMAAARMLNLIGKIVLLQLLKIQLQN